MVMGNKCVRSIRAVVKVGQEEVEQSGILVVCVYGGGELLLYSV